MPREIDRHEVQRLAARGAQVVDVMGTAEWEESHIAGALHVPLQQLDELAPQRLDRTQAVITYCYDSL
jgi:rhodanese-related sulfurtransferase